MGGATVFDRRPNAPDLPAVQLPPPQFHSMNPFHKPAYQPSTTLTSVGNLLTPPSNSSADGISPSSGISSSAPLSSHGAVQAYTPNGTGGMWPPPSTTGSTPYGYQSSGTPVSFPSGRALFSPSLNSIVGGTRSPAASDSLPPPPFEIPQYSQSMPMSAPTSYSQHQGYNPGVHGQHTPVSAPVTQASPVSAQDAFARPPPTPTYYTQQQSSTSSQHGYSYSGPSPVQQSPMTSNPLKMSPVNQHGSIPPLQSHSTQQYSQHRPYSYPMNQPVLSNVANPNGQLTLVGGGMPHGMMQGFNSGHAAQMHQLYGHHPQQPNAQNDRPFRCDQCPQSFNRNHDLKRHKRIHLAVKPFPCGHCDKSFSRKDALKRHVLVKGCGNKTASTAEVKEIDPSQSPEPKSESTGHSPHQ